MSFAAPWWLLALIPWSGVVVWLLWGRRRRVDIPFLELWKGPVEPPKERRAMQAPPLWLAIAMAAMLAAVVGAARPSVRGRGDGPAISVIVDRGVTMSGRGKARERYREVIDEAARVIGERFGSGVVELIAVPGEARQTNRAEWAGIAKGLPPTAMDTTESVRAAVMRRLTEGAGPVFVLSDQTLDIKDRRVVQIAPAGSPENVGIIGLAIREVPVPEAMVRIRNDSRQRRAMLRVMSDGQAMIQMPVDLPGAGQERTYFVDVGGLRFGRVVSAEIAVVDDLPADNRRSVVRQQVWPAVEAGTPLPAEIRRMIDIYGRRYPAGENSKHIAVVSSVDALPVNVPAAAVTLEAAVASTTRPAGEIEVADHPITRQINDWSALLSGGGAQPPAGEGWRRLVRAGDRTLVAVREASVRQVWTVHNEEWARTPYQFVAFWTNVFNWLGEGGEAFASQPVGRLGSEWRPLMAGMPEGVESGLWPGVYERGRALVAVNCADVRMPGPTKGDWRRAVGELSEEYAPGAQGRPLGGWLLAGALAAMGVAAVAWRREGREAAHPAAR